MPFLNNIVDSLNKHWQNSSLKFIPPANMMQFGISEAMIEPPKDETQATKRYPSIVDNDGEVTPIMIDDCYSLLMYHKVESVTNTVNTKDGFGNSPSQLEVANMSVIVFGFRDKIRREAYWLEAALKDGMPDRLTTKDNQNRIVQTATLKVGNSSFDKFALLGRDYSEVDINFPNLLGFEMKYRIESTWKKGCFTKNNCGCEAG